MMIYASMEVRQWILQLGHQGDALLVAIRDLFISIATAKRAQSSRPVFSLVRQQRPDLFKNQQEEEADPGEFFEHCLLTDQRPLEFRRLFSFSLHPCLACQRSPTVTHLSLPITASSCSLQTLVEEELTKCYDCRSRVAVFFFFCFFQV